MFPTSPRLFVLVEVVGYHKNRWGLAWGNGEAVSVKFRDF